MSLNKVIKYFAFGSNMLTARMHVNNPKSTYIGIGKLDGHRFTFSSDSDLWCGSTATLVEDESSYVWGVVYDLPVEYIDILDKQEVGYDYKMVDVNVDGTLINCKTYVLKTNFTGDSFPSKAYKTVILKGAEEKKLPTDYQEFLKNIPDNGKEGPMDFVTKMLQNK